MVDNNCALIRPGTYVVRGIFSVEGVKKAGFGLQSIGTTDFSKGVVHRTAQHTYFSEKSINVVRKRTYRNT